MVTTKQMTKTVAGWSNRTLTRNAFAMSYMTYSVAELIPDTYKLYEIMRKEVGKRNIKFELHKIKRR